MYVRVSDRWGDVWAGDWDEFVAAHGANFTPDEFSEALRTLRTTGYAMLRSTTSAWFVECITFFVDKGLNLM